MFRMRRYRVFLVFAIIAIGALYHFTSLADVESAGADSVEGLKNLASKGESSTPPPASEPENGDATGGKDTTGPIAVPNFTDLGSPTSSSSIVGESEVPSTPTSLTKPSLKDELEDADEEPTKSHAPSSVATPTSAFGSESGNKTTKPHSGPADPIINPHGEDGRLEIIAVTTGIPKIHWSQQPEHFPVPTENIIQLPTGKPKAIPKIQHDFKTESAEEKTDREEKRDIIKKSFSFSWAGYKKKAWTQDELTPVSGKFRNPFNGWGATLVDTLDTLWIMGLKDEFEEAVEAVRDIDFTTSPRNDIPLFETVIRYLGGLVAAYDVSDGAHRILLDKAVELADILMGAFDTPNRMPMTFYLWKPTFASQPHRAKTRVVLAELGSLSVEFTRLAQITKEARYYDAVARITNEFDIWQNNTRLPGLWPIKVDASGCKKPDMSSSQASYDHTAEYGSSHNAGLIGESSQNQALLHEGSAKKALDEGVSPTAERIIHDTSEPAYESMQKAVQPASSTNSSKEPAGAEKRLSSASSTGHNLSKRQIDPETGLDPHPDTQSAKAPDCEPQGLASPPFTMTEEFGIGGQADSTYEYLPKEYMLLGGLEEKYRTMYERFAEVTTEKLLFRPMIRDEKRHLLHAGLARVDNKKSPLKLTPEGTHLTCFAGGMYAVGAKIFGREEDMDIAKKLTDGCVWAYESTTTGIMPESYLVVPCPDPVDCPWNETLWYEQLDPYGHVREQQRLQQEQKVLENEKMSVEASEEEVSPSDAPKASFTAGQAVSRTQQSMAATSDAEVSLTKAEQAVGKPVAEPVEPAEEKAAKAVSKSTDGIATESDSAVPEKDAETSSSKPTEGAVPPKARGKRQLGDVNEAGPIESEDAAPVSGVSTEPVVQKGTAEQHSEKSNNTAQGMGSKASGSNHTNVSPNAAKYTPVPIPTREEFAKDRIKNERLPEGMTKVTGGRYLLRPEAIESVFIMYRATGDVYWREKGWEMFKAIEKHTIATYGASAINDVTSEKPATVDEMESFWLAETLKYFYLLFSEPTLISLDDYVLNTEAHAFKRPK